MPKKGKNKGKRHGKHQSLTSSTSPYVPDVSLSQFANSKENRPGPSMRKSNNTLAMVLRENQLEKEIKSPKEELDWFEIDPEEYDGIDGNRDSDLALPKTNQYKSKSSSPAKQSKETDDCGTDLHKSSAKMYPADMWFIIADFIRPEDIGRFASICKDTYVVTCTARFWVRLYNRYKIYVPDMPLRLQPEFISVKLDGLKASVVRALYYFYTPYVEKCRINQQQEAHCLVMRKCALMWHQRGRYLHTYFFKMEEKCEGGTDLGTAIKKTELTHFRNMLGDVEANSEEKFQVLQIISSNFVSVPPAVMGETLIYVSYGMSQDFKGHDVRLIFGPRHIQQYFMKGRKPNSNIPDGCIEIAFMSVVMTKVLNWWSPNYPCTSLESSSICDQPRNGGQNAQLVRQSDLYF